MTKKIALLGKDNHPLGYSLPCIEWGSNDSLFDYDVLIVDPLATINEYILQARPPYSYVVGDAFLKRMNGIDDFLNHGRVAVIFVRPYPELTGTVDGHETKFDSNLHFYNSAIDPIVGKSTDIERGLSEPFISFLKATTKYYRYEGVLSEPQGDVLLRINGTQRVVASYTWLEQRKIFFLPCVNFEGLNYSPSILSFIGALNDLIVALEVKEKISDYELPDTHIQYLLPEEASLQHDTANFEKDIADSILALNKANTQLDIEQSYKHLFLSNGDALTAAVSRALSDIGFEVKDGPVGRDDLICEYDGRRAVVEVKGRENRSAAEKDSAQLEKWAARELEESGVPAKPILIVNGFCNVPLVDRTEPVFPHQMRAYAEKRDHCLCSGIDLFLLSHMARTNPEIRKEILERFFSTIGVLMWEKIPDWPTVILLEAVDKAA